MPPTDLGIKHTCFKCGANQRDSPAVKAPPAEKRARAAARKPEPKLEVAEGDEEVALDEDGDEKEEEEDS
jgi:predicted  nucleic acid-binding Zn-ribbon protein